MISIIIPTYNRANFLPRAINSVINQTYTDWELIIVDDGSTDGTEKIIKFYKQKNNKIKYLKLQKNVGATKARNIGMKESRGHYITFLDSDDEYLPTKIEKQFLLFKNSKIKNLGVVSCGRIDIRNGKEYFKWVPKYRGNILPQLLSKKRVGAGTPFLMIKREVIEKNILFDPEMPAGQDYDFLIRIAQNFNFDFVPEPLVKVYHHNFNRVYNETTVLKAIDMQYAKYKTLITQNKNYYTGFILKKTELFFIYHKKTEALKILKEHFKYLKWQKFLWLIYFNLFQSTDKKISRFFLKVIRKFI